MRFFKILFSIVSITIGFTPIQAQTFEYTDSIKNPQEYILALAAMTRAEISFANQDVDSVLFYYNEVISKSETYDFSSLHADALHSLGRVYVALGEKDTALIIFTRAAESWRKAQNFLGLNKTLTNAASIMQDRGMNIEGLNVTQEAIDAGKKSDYPRGTGIANLQRGNFLFNVARYEEALQHFLDATDVFQTIDFEAGVGMCYNNIANIYNILEQHERALEYYMRNFTLQQKTGNKLEYANSALNIGVYYIGYKGNNYEQFETRRNVDSLFHYLTIALETYEEVQYPLGIIQASTNLGFAYLYSKTPDFDRARTYFNRAETLATQFNVPAEIARAKRNKAFLLARTGQHVRAIELFNEAKELFIELNQKEDELMLYKRIAEAYAETNDYKTAFEFLQRYDIMNDSLRQKESQRLIDQLSIRFESELKDQEIASARIREQDLEARNLVQKRFNLVLQIGISIFGIFLILVFYQFLQKRKANALLLSRNVEITKQKEEIELQRNQVLQQKDIIEEQQLNILDSIHYASRIQEAILPQDEALYDLFGNNLFILFKPRDIVSGDFYWLGKKGNKKIILAADCTGHGVPGAFMSMLGTAFLNEIIISESNDVTSHVILNRLREYVITSLRQTGKEGEQKDGMDVSLCVYDEETRIADFSGANNPLIIVRESSVALPPEDNERIKIQELISESNSKPYNVIQIQGDKMPIGIYAEQKPFSSVQIQLLPNDLIYAFSDGYQDQFGGEKNKKFMVKRLKQLFVDIHSFDAQSQQQLLDKTILHWMKEGNAEQIDDILVIGLKII